MRKGIALFCTIFMLVSSTYAQSNRVGVYVLPQYTFFSTKKFSFSSNPATEGKGFVFNGGIFYEKKWEFFGLSVGAGYAQMKTKEISQGIEATYKRGFVSVPLGINYEYDITDNLFIGGQATLALSLRLSEKKEVAGIDVSEEVGLSMYSTYGVGLSFTYLFTDAVGLSVLPTFSATSGRGTPFYWGVGGQIRFFYAFGD